MKIPSNSAVRKLSQRSEKAIGSGVKATQKGQKASSLPPRHREHQGASRESRRGVNCPSREIEEPVNTSEIVAVVDGKDAGEKASSPAPRRGERRGTSREPRRGVKFGTREMEELVEISQIVPVVERNPWADSALDQPVQSDGKAVGAAHCLCADSAHSLGQLVFYGPPDFMDSALGRSILGSTAAGRMRKNSIDSDTASTKAPTSAEPSPMLGFVIADSDATKWPSLRAASAPGWDFCDGSDDEDLLPDPAMSLDDDSTSGQEASPASWCYVPASGYVQSEVPQVSEPNSKPSFADMVREQPTDQAGHVLPPAPAALMPPFRARPLQRRNAASTQHAGDVADEVDEEADFVSGQHHGWTKKHKAPRSKSYQRDLAEHMAQRKDQPEW